MRVLCQLCTPVPAVVCFPVACWCSESKETCPLHVLGPVLEGCTHGAMLFPAITPASALGVLRDLLTKLGVANADAYRTHDFRRGHAQDLVESGRCNTYCIFGLCCASSGSEAHRFGSFWPRANGNHQPLLRILISIVSKPTWLSVHMLTNLMVSSHVVCALERAKLRVHDRMHDQLQWV